MKWGENVKLVFIETAGDCKLCHPSYLSVWVLCRVWLELLLLHILGHWNTSSLTLKRREGKSQQWIPSNTSWRNPNITPAKLQWLWVVFSAIQCLDLRLKPLLQRLWNWYFNSGDSNTILPFVCQRKWNLLSISLNTKSNILEIIINKGILCHYFQIGVMI